MTKLIWLLSTLVVIATAEDAFKMAPPMLNINEDAIQRVDRISENPIPVDKQLPQAQLPPIQPIFPSFIQSGLSETEQNEKPMPRHGILTILVIKSKKPDGTIDQDASKTFEESLSKINQFKSQVGDSFSKLAGLIMNDLFNSHNNEQKLIGGGSEDVERKSVHLLGGKDDIDSTFNRLVNQDQLNSDEDQEEVEEEEQQQETNINSSKFQSMMSWFKLNRAEQPDTVPQSLIIRTSDGHSSIINMDEDLNTEQKKKCMMYSFMRLKASIYYRTIVHLLFITGVMLIIFFMAILTVRVFKRRQALRYYSKNMKIATIEEQKKMPFESTPRSMFLFRLGSLKKSYAQKSVDSVMSAPPSYDKLNESELSVKTNSVKAKYAPLTSEQNDEDRKSLPGYEESAASKDQI